MACTVPYKMRPWEPVGVVLLLVLLTHDLTVEVDRRTQNTPCYRPAWRGSPSQCYSPPHVSFRRCTTPGSRSINTPTTVREQRFWQPRPPIALGRSLHLRPPPSNQGLDSYAADAPLRKTDKLATASSRMWNLESTMPCIVQLSAVHLRQQKAYRGRAMGGDPKRISAHANPKRHNNSLPSPNYLLTHVCPFLAFLRPCFFLSTVLGSRVTQPAGNATG